MSILLTKTMTRPDVSISWNGDFHWESKAESTLINDEISQDGLTRTSTFRYNTLEDLTGDVTTNPDGSQLDGGLDTSLKSYLATNGITVNSVATDESDGSVVYTVKFPE